MYFLMTNDVEEHSIIEARKTIRTYGRDFR